MMVAVKNGYLAEFPAGSLPCPACGSAEQTLVFRGWARLVAFIVWTRESRSSAYLCSPCARTETAKALIYNTLLGWWSIWSMLFYGWKVTYVNWRSVWAPPADPHEWGAISAAEFAADIRGAHEEAVSDADEDWLLTETPFGDLNETQFALVMQADNLYELLGVDRHADTDTIRRAYRARCKESHPDLQNATARESTDTMVQLNRAWEILRSPEMRRAYDWREEQLSEEAIS